MSLFNNLRRKKSSSGIVSAVGPIGFHLSRDKLHMIQLKKHAGGLRLYSGLSVRYPGTRESLYSSPKDFKSFVKKALKTGKFKSNEIVTCLPDGVKIINLSYKIAEGQKIEEEIVKSVTSSLGGVAEDYIIDYVPIRSEEFTSPDKSVLAFVASRERTVSYLDLLSNAGLHVQALDVGPSSLGRLVSSLDLNKTYPHNLLINFAENKSYLSVFDGRRLIMDRALPLGLDNLLNKLSKSLAIEKEKGLEMLTRFGFQAKKDFDANGPGIHDQDIIESIVEISKPFFSEISKEVNKMLLFTKSETRGKTIDHIYLLGCIVRFPGAERFISDIFSFPSSVLDPLECFAINEDRAQRRLYDGPPQIALSVGFAMRGMI